MLKALVDNPVNMVVCQRIEHRLSVPAALDKLRLLENPKLMRNRRLRHIKQLCNVADTHFRLKQHKQNPDPRRITKYLKQLRQIIQIIVIRQHSPDRLHNLIVNSTLLTALYIMNCHPISPFMLRVSALQTASFVKAVCRILTRFL